MREREEGWWGGGGWWGEGWRKEKGGGGIRVLRSRSSCQIVCNISSPLVSSTQLDRFSLSHSLFLLISCTKAIIILLIISEGRFICNIT